MLEMFFETQCRHICTWWVNAKSGVCGQKSPIGPKVKPWAQTWWFITWIYALLLNNHTKCFTALQFQVFVDDVKLETKVFWDDLTKATVAIVFFGKCNRNLAV